MSHGLVKRGAKSRARRWVVEGRKEISRFFGVSITAIDKWRERGMPGEPGAWDLSAIAAWILDRRAAGRKEGEGADANAPDREYKRLRSALLRLRLKRERGTVIERSFHDEYCRRLCAHFREALLSIPPTLAAALEGLDQKARTTELRRRFEDLLSDLSGDDDAAPREPDGEPTKEERGAIGSEEKPEDPLAQAKGPAAQGPVAQRTGGS